MAGKRPRGRPPKRPRGQKPGTANRYVEEDPKEEPYQPLQEQAKPSPAAATADDQVETPTEDQSPKRHRGRRPRIAVDGNVEEDLKEPEQPLQVQAQSGPAAATAGDEVGIPTEGRPPQRRRGRKPRIAVNENAEEDSNEPDHLLNEQAQPGPAAAAAYAEVENPTEGQPPKRRQVRKPRTITNEGAGESDQTLQEQAHPGPAASTANDEVETPTEGRPPIRHRGRKPRATTNHVVEEGTREPDQPLQEQAQTGPAAAAADYEVKTPAEGQSPKQRQGQKPRNAVNDVVKEDPREPDRPLQEQGKPGPAAATAVYGVDATREKVGSTHVNTGQIEGGLRVTAADDEFESPKEKLALTYIDSVSTTGNVWVEPFDYSVDKFFEYIDAIANICQTVNDESLDPHLIRHFSSNITFLTEWKHFYYQPKTVRFAYETGSPVEKEFITGINLPQFSAANIPNNARLSGEKRLENLSKDFVLHVGGPVWGLDWCPRTHQKLDHHAKCEYLAVSAHPPDSSYHKMGAPLIGRGIIQIWCLLNVGFEEPSLSKPKRKGRKRLPRMDPLVDSCTGDVPTPDLGQSLLGNTDASDGLDKAGATTRMKKRRMKDDASAGAFNDNLSSVMLVGNLDSKTIHESQGAESQGASPVRTTSSIFAASVTLPRLVLCLAHNAKVAWDVKWRPSNADDPEYRHHMGYLAVILGNGSLEVWEVPFPWMIKTIYNSLCREGTDPRFVKLEPVFRCSKMKCGDRQSIPLSVEWSTSAPHDLLLAGCHDGTVAIWKFSARRLLEDTRPLLRFTADTSPIRAIAWAPDVSDAESSNLIVTAGHEGLRFWDIRDPYHPLWDLNPVRRVLSVNWVENPRCLVLSVDDGTMRLLCLPKAANDVPVTGKSFVGTQLQGFHSFVCSSFSIWSIHVSKFTGQVAYCSADGSALRFRLTSKAVEKDFTRNKAPHFLCGSLTIDDSSLTLNIPLPNVPSPMKKSLKGFTDTSRSVGGFQSTLVPTNKRSGQTLGFANCLYSPRDKAPKPKASRRNDSTIEHQECFAGEADKQEKLCGGKNPSDSKDDFEVLPPKIVAMHRVRWNMNKGSERWLCFGGAAGIIRCYEVQMSTIL